MRVRLPLIYCPDCRTQLVNHLYYDHRRHELLCIWCAKNRPRGSVAAINEQEAGAVSGEAAPMDPIDAIALLARYGAKVIK